MKFYKIFLQNRVEKTLIVRYNVYRKVLKQEGIIMEMFSKYSNMDSDETVVLIHGMASDSSTWHNTEALLKSKGYNVLSFDLAGHGDSPRAKKYSFINWVWDVMDEMDAYPNVTTIVGHSMGGLLAAGVAARNKNIEKMLLLDPLLHVPSPVMRAVVKKVMANRTAASYDHLRKTHPTWSDPMVQDELISLSKWDVKTLEALNPAEGWEMASDFLEKKGHAETLVLKPTHSFLIPQRYVSTLEDYGVQVNVIPHVGHSLHKDNMKVYTEILDSMVERKIPLMG